MIFRDVSGRSPWLARRSRGLALTAGLVVIVASCAGGGNQAAVVSPSDLGHIHDFVPDGDGMLVAAHRGLHRLDGDRLTAVGSEVNDLMAMARLSGGQIIASGHPDMRVERYRVDGLPSYLGLVRSDDGGVTWQIVDLLGEADFHALAPTADGFFAAEATGTVWKFDAEGQGQPVGSLPFEPNDLAASPDDAAMLIATSYDGQVATSDDAAQTWELLDDVPTLLEVEWVDGSTVGIDLDGVVWVAAAPTGPYTQIGSVPGEPDSLLVAQNGEMWAATRGGLIWRSADAASWQPVASRP